MSKCLSCVWSVCLLSCLLGLGRQVQGGCSFANQGLSAKKHTDLDAARFAAKMALAHQGQEVDTLKERQKRSREGESYIPNFITNEEGNETKGPEKVEQVEESDIWDLSERSNKNNPRQDLGKIDTEAKLILPEGCPHAQAAKIEL
eukprot:GFUD01003857.1.p1 GENE.GFUD01003857.1~~GFUD01003857.1.p1  ORF type:complete len:146 (-),score=48.61 GFUD01003857.1:48-485(-)